MIKGREEGLLKVKWEGVLNISLDWKRDVPPVPEKISVNKDWDQEVDHEQKFLSAPVLEIFLAPSLTI